METLDIVQLAQPLRVLVVDDSRAIQAIIKRSISQCGFEPIEILTAADGEQAVEVVEKAPIDLIITDWHMPKLSGLDMLQTIRHRGHRNVRIGFVTTERSQSMLNEAKLSGAAFILHKPFEDGELQSTVRANVSDIVAARSATKEACPRVVRNQDPVPFGEMQIALARKLGNIPFRLIPNEKLSTARLTENNLLGLYASKNSKGVYAVGVMDTNAICIIGGGAARKTPLEVRAAMANAAPDTQMLDRAHEFLNGLAEAMGKSSADRSEVTLLKASMVKNSFAKLVEVVEQSGNRSDYRISIPGYGEGRMAFFLLAS